MRFGQRLFAKYVVLIFSVVGLLLVAGSALTVHFAVQQTKSQLTALQREQAQAAATRIGLYLRGIEHEVGWTTLGQAGAATLDARRIDYIKLLRQEPAITEVAWIDNAGKEQLRLSRVKMDVLHSGEDFSASEAVRTVKAGHVYYSDVYFRKETEPYMTIARAAGPAGGGTVLAQVNLKFVWDVITQVRVGQRGLAYVVDGDGTLIAHPDISLVLQQLSVTSLPQVASLLAHDKEAAPIGRNLKGAEVLTASAAIPQMQWHVFVELPLEEAFAPVYDIIYRSALLLMGGLVLSVLAAIFLARRMVRPIRALQDGAASIGSGQLEHRIELHTGDELEALGEHFNAMSARLRESYANLEQKIAERTRALSDKNTELNAAMSTLRATQERLVELVAERTAQQQRAETADQAKSRFLAAASHDLRQPMHALNLYLEALGELELPEHAGALVDHVQRCAHTMDEMFGVLLDISRLDANLVRPNRNVVAVAAVLERLRIEFGPPARAKGLQLRVARCSAHVWTDAAMLERILRNLVSNAVRYTECGSVLVGCRRCEGQIQIGVYDTGPGIAPELHGLVFEEFYQVHGAGRDSVQGLGLGLAMARRLARLLDAPLTLRSRPDQGAVFAVQVASAPASERARHTETQLSAAPSLRGALVVVVDDDATIRTATSHILEQWGCLVVAAASGSEAITRVAGVGAVPDALVCDYCLADGEDGVTVVAALRDEFNEDIPALLVTGDISQDVARRGLPVLHKPVSPAALRRALAQLIESVQVS